jgi:aryl-alcohol dehydrogenase
MRVQAAVLRDPNGEYQLESVDLADPRGDEVLVRVVGAGMCHTDAVLRAPGFAALPMIPGHEGAGVVEAVGPDVHDIAVDDHVVLSFGSCGECVNCRDRHPAYCYDFFPQNITGRYPDGSTSATGHDGKEIGNRWFQQSSFATHAMTTARNVVRVEKDLPLATLAPLGCGVQTGAGTVLNVLKVRAGESVVVFGCGAVGLAAVMTAKLVEAGPIIAIDLHDHRLRLAAELGATHWLRGDDPDLSAQLLDMTGGGTRHAIDTTGNPAAIGTAIGVLRPLGTLGLVGVVTGPITLAPMDLAVGRRLVGVIEGDAVPQRFVPQLIEWWRDGRFPIDRLITFYPLAEVNAAERDSLSGATVKPVLLPGTESV